MAARQRSPHLRVQASRRDKTGQACRPAKEEARLVSQGPQAVTSGPAGWPGGRRRSWGNLDGATCRGTGIGRRRAAVSDPELIVFGAGLARQGGGRRSQGECASPLC